MGATIDLLARQFQDRIVISSSNNRLNFRLPWALQRSPISSGGGSWCMGMCLSGGGEARYERFGSMRVGKFSGG